MQVPHHAIQNVSFNWDDHDKFLPGEHAKGCSDRLHICTCVQLANPMVA